MEVEHTVPLASLPQQQRVATILCCQCGAPIDGTSAETFNALCPDCIKLSVDISQGIEREGTLHICRDCDRWLSPPSQWVMAAMESRELLALCLKKLRGLNRARIVDASFIWTEPHSRRVKLKITIQSEASAGTIIQQTFEVEFVVVTKQCPDCAKSYTHNTWRANVQVRQKVPHKKTFLYLEQIILKYQAHKETINIKECDNGIDFYFAQRNHAERFVEFLTSVVPVRGKKSQTLISEDIQNSTKSYKFNYSIEIIPICRDDLVALPLKLARQLGNIAPLTLCHKVGTAVYLIDPKTLQSTSVPPHLYWRSPFSSLADSRALTEFIVMDIEPLPVAKESQEKNPRFILAEATVRRASDFGVNDQEYNIRTHLGKILKPGDSAWGYDLEKANFNNPNLEDIENNKKTSDLPEVVLVKKMYPRRQKKKNRSWRLRRMAREAEEGAAKRQDADQEVMDYEMFLRDVEEDEELRQTINLYKAQQRAKTAKTEDVEMEQGSEIQQSHGDTDVDEGLEIPLDQLRDEFEDMTMEDNE